MEVGRGYRGPRPPKPTSGRPITLELELKPARGIDKVSPHLSREGFPVGNVHSPEMLYWFGELALIVLYTRAMNTTHYLQPPHGLCEQARDLQV